MDQFTERLLSPALWAAAAYMIGSIPFAYIIVKAIIGEDVTTHGSGNVGAMNVRRSTGSWGWFTVAMIGDALKGILPVAAAKLLASGMAIQLPYGSQIADDAVLSLLSPPGLPDSLGMMASAPIPIIVVAGAVLGHNYSLWMAIIKKRFSRTGKGLATGGGALLAYDWRYFVAVVAVGLAIIFITRYMMAGQVAAAATLPLTALLLGSPDWPFALLMGAVVYAAHHKRFMGLLAGAEPKFYINDGMGPKG